MEEIEILDFDDDIKKEIKEEVPLKKKQDEPIDKPKKGKKRMRKGEKFFLLANVLLIFGIIGFYAYRTVHYYKLTHDVITNVTLKDKLTALDKIAFKDDGLYENNGYFYYKGANVDNYVYYSGRLFRIIDIDKGIRMIEDETPTNLVWGINGDFENSNINKWLTNYLTTLKDYEVYLNENSWCNESIDIENYHCEKETKSYVGLLSTKDYLNAGGKTSYLNNETYFWTLNQDKDGKTLYINDEGSINNIVNNENNYFSYGIRPVITLKEDIMFISGTGTMDDPYIVEEIGKALLKDNCVGNYLTYNDKTYRILKIEEDGVSLILDNVLEVEKNYNELYKYLNNEFIKDFKKEDLVKQDYSLIAYNYDNKYAFTSDQKTGSEYIIIPKIGDLFLNEYGNYWLSNLQDSKLGLYYTIDENKMFFGDLKSNKHLLRPIIKVNGELVVSSGNGMKTNPLVIGESNEEVVE